MKDRLLVYSETKMFHFVYYGHSLSGFSFLWIVEAAKKHYNTVKVLFEAGEIETYKQLIAHLPYSTLAKDLNIHPPRMKRIYKDVSKMTLGELYRLSRVLNIKFEDLEIMVFKEFDGGCPGAE